MDIEKKPKLPSIGFMLQSIGVEEEPQKRLGHRRQASDLYPVSSALRDGAYLDMPAVGGLPSRMQKLSISKLAAVEPHHSGESLMRPPHPSTSSSYTGVTLPFHHVEFQQQRPSNKAMHARSYSDYTHPYPPSSSSSSSSAVPNYLQPGTCAHHRRAISTDSLDFILQRQQHHHTGLHGIAATPTTATMALSPASITTASTLENDTTASSKSPAMSEDGESDHSESLSENRNKQADEGAGSGSTNRYCCPYCSKRFTRPSSLRIHTYSHTGEKPFVCTEPGCAKRFSVHSNMRRHLRVHRTGKISKRSIPVQIRALEIINSNRIHQRWLNEETSEQKESSPYEFAPAHS